MDITEMILAQHHEQRRMFALLDELPRADRHALAAVWKRLTVLLEVHAEAEERYFYPRLLSVGLGEAGESVDSETKDAIKDHNDIRDAIAKADDHPTPSGQMLGGRQSPRPESPTATTWPRKSATTSPTSGAVRISKPAT